VYKYRHLLEILYKRYCYDGRYVFIDKSRFSTIVQRRLKTDTVIQKETDVSYGIEEKVVSWPEKKGKPHTAFFLETRSCTNPGHESSGWMETSCADYLLYAFEIKDVGLDVYIFNFPRLQHWFRKHVFSNSRYRFHTMPDENRTEGKLVPIADVVKYIPTERFLLTFEGICKPLRLEVDILSPVLKRKIEGLLARLPSPEVDGENDCEEEVSEDWQEVHNRVEEILVQQQVDQLLFLAEQRESQV
jgi:hypothetical protein